MRRWPTSVRPTMASPPRSPRCTNWMPACAGSSNGPSAPAARRATPCPAPPRSRAAWSGLCLGTVLVLGAVTAVERLDAQTPPPAQAPPLTGVDLVRSAYTKYEYQVPMRDGARLFTAVYVPKDASKTYPFLLIRTPY